MSGSSSSILVVDDDANILETAKDILEDAGYQVETAGTVNAAMQQLEEATFQLMLVDLNLPDGRGLDLGARAQALQPGLLVILLTGEANLQLDGSVKVFEYLVKPVNPLELLQTIRKALP